MEGENAIRNLAIKIIGRNLALLPSAFFRPETSSRQTPKRQHRRQAHLYLIIFYELLGGFQRVLEKELTR